MSDIRAQLAAVGGEYRAIRDSLACCAPLIVAARGDGRRVIPIRALPAEVMP